MKKITFLTQLISNSMPEHQHVSQQNNKFYYLGRLNI